MIIYSLFREDTGIPVWLHSNQEIQQTSSQHQQQSGCRYLQNKKHVCFREGLSTILKQTNKQTKKIEITEGAMKLSCLDALSGQPN